MVRPITMLKPGGRPNTAARPNTYIPPRMDPAWQTWTAYTPNNATELRNLLDGTTPTVRPAIIYLDPSTIYAHLLADENNEFAILEHTQQDSGWLYLISTNHALLPAEGNRVTPADSANMPVVSHAWPNKFSLSVGIRAKNIRIVGLQITNTSDFAVNRSMLATSRSYSDIAQSAAERSENVVIDRCYIHGNTLDQQHNEGAELTGNNIALIDSYFDRIQGTGATESHGVTIRHPSQGVTIWGNYFDVVGSAVFLGGEFFGGSSGVQYVGNIEDIDIRYNYSTKNPRYNPSDPSYTPPASGTWTDKNIGETKAGRRVYYGKNYGQNVFRSDLQGYLFNNKAVSQGGTTPFFALTDCILEYNEFRAAPYGPVFVPFQLNHSMVEVDRIEWRNNLFVAHPLHTFPANGFSASFDLEQLTSDKRIANLTIDGNTFTQHLQDQNPVAGNAYYGGASSITFSIRRTEDIKPFGRLNIRNNIFGQAIAGGLRVSGFAPTLLGDAALAAIADEPAWINNIIFGRASVTADPSGTFNVPNIESMFVHNHETDPQPYGDFDIAPAYTSIGAGVNYTDLRNNTNAARTGDRTGEDTWIP